MRLSETRVGETVIKGRHGAMKMMEVLGVQVTSVTECVIVYTGVLYMHRKGNEEKCNDK